MHKKIFLMILVGVMLIGTISAWEFDNTYRYDEVNDRVTIENAFGFGEDLGYAELLWGDTIVPAGVDIHVGTFGVEFYDGYDSSVFDDLRLDDLKEGKRASRNINYKVKRVTEQEEIITPIYTTECNNETLGNGTIIQNCVEVFSHNKTTYEDIVEWVDIKNPNFNFQANTYYEIGIFSDVEAGDVMDWKPNFLGTGYIDEWANFSQSTASGLKRYYRFDETTGAIIDEMFNDHLIDQASATRGETGLVNNALDLDTFGTDWLQTSGNIGITSNAVRSMCFWLNVDNLNANANWIALWGANVANQGYGIFIANDGSLYTWGAAADDDTGYDLNTNEWYYICSSYDGSTNEIYLNGTSIFNGSRTYNTADSTLKLGRSGDGNTRSDFRIDELGIWNRSLTTSEVSELYNSGTGTNNPRTDNYWNSYDLDNNLISYYKMDGDLTDELGNYSGNNVGTTNTSGKILDARDLEYSEGDWIDLGTDFDFETTDPRTFSIWVNMESFATTYEAILVKQDLDSPYQGWGIFIPSSGARLQYVMYKSITTNEQIYRTLATPETIPTSQWSHIVVTYDGSASANGINIYYNGINLTNQVDVYNNLDDTDDTSNGAVPFNIGGRDNSTQFDGKVDEIGIWNVSLNSTQVQALFNYTSALVYGSSETPPDNPPTVTLNSPVDTLNTTSGDIDFNVTVTDDIQVSNVTFYLNDAVTSQDLSGTNGTYIFSQLGLAEGTYTWFISAYDNASQQTNSSTRSLTIDSTNPVVTLVDPSNLSYYQNQTDNNVTIPYNFNVVETNIDTCWFNYGLGTEYNKTNANGFNQAWDLDDRQLVLESDPRADLNFETGIPPYTELIASSNSSYTNYYTTAPDCNGIDLSLYTSPTINNPPANSYICALSSNKTIFLVKLVDTRLQNVNINYTAYNKQVLPSCSNSTFTLNSSTTLNTTIYANDTIGNFGYSNLHRVYVNEFSESFVYNGTIIEETSQQVNLTLDMNGGVFDSLEGNITYNGTTSTCSVDNQTLFCDVTAPSVGVTENTSFYYTYILNGETFNSTTQNQTIYNFTGIEVSSTGCSAGLTEVLRFQFRSENNKTNINTTGVYIFRYGLISNSSQRTSKGNYSTTNVLSLCVNSTLSSTFYMGYGEIQYQESNEAYSERRYYVFEGTRLTNETINNTVYSLNNADSTSFLMTIQGSSLTPYTGYYLGLNRWFPEDDNYQTVELARTDDEGQTVLKVKVEDVDYRLGIYYPNGTLVHLTSAFRLVCVTSPCSYTVTIPSDSADLYDRWEGLETSLTYNETTGIITYIYNDPTQTTQNMTLNVYKVTGTSNVLICTDTAEGYLGVMSCNVTGYTGLIKAVGVRTASPTTEVISKLLNLAQTALDNNFAMFITLVVTALLVFIGIYSPVLGVILTVIGFIPALVFGLLPLGVIMAILCLGFFVIYFMRKQ